MTYTKVVAAADMARHLFQYFKFSAAVLGDIGETPTLTNRKFEHLDFLPYAWPCLHPCLTLNYGVMFGLPVCNIVHVFLKQ